MLASYTIATFTVGAMASGATAFGILAPSEDSTDPDDDEALRTPCGAVGNRLPDDLQDDLEELRDLSPAERRETLASIRGDALRGQYGARAERMARRIPEIRAELRERLPAELRQDLSEVRQLSVEKLADVAHEVAGDAAAGEHGEQVESLADRLQERRATCAD